jgi:hypothetical protein
MPTTSRAAKKKSAKKAGRKAGKTGSSDDSDYPNIIEEPIRTIDNPRGNPPKSASKKAGSKKK